ncbi:MAG: methyltransferase domain-containing protein [Xanthomonadaceae bacterium]|nr:methyltransferase domain-containing protein [Xanthomonadaceae bacterium]MDE1958266.1 methyltransferase domain-containing protein [Xanthomonadaceae bacterium]MDE2176991.1 methyltransferase domain-containing protein [Xanthomonadaceae bacterium]MDE2245747.1 methyltransferase domain-containing protein [Xanthomonadaceae bacterium]
MPDRRPPSSAASWPSAPGYAFFRAWLRDPLAVAALSPSGRQLARLMVEQLPSGAERVIELGGGTGVFTRALLDAGVRADRLLVLELNEPLHQLLQQQFPGVGVVCADARDLRGVARRSGFLDEGPADVVLSGLGLLSMPRRTQRAILEAAFAVMHPGGRLIQFTYGPVSPVPRPLLDQLRLTVHRGGFAWWNMPPASVYVYRRADDAPPP